MIGIRIIPEQADALHETLNDAFTAVMAMRAADAENTLYKSKSIDSIMAVRRALDRMGIHHSRELRQLNAG